jgi:hypothetical protein
MRFLYVCLCLIFYNVLTNFLLPLVLFIHRQGSVLLQHVISCVFYRRVVRHQLFVTTVLSSIPLQSGTSYGCQVGLTSHHWIKNHVSHFWLDFILVLWPQAITMCKLNLANLDTPNLRAIYMHHFLYPSTHVWSLQISWYGADIANGINP